MAGSATPFEAYLGISQGRIAPSAVTPDDGNWALALGDALHRVADIELDDYVEATQSLDLTGIDVIRIGQAVYRDAEQALGDWTLVLLVDGTQIDAVQFFAGDEVKTGLGIDVSQHSGVHDVTIRLTIE